jgi:DnaJ-class molecular chaperone
MFQAMDKSFLEQFNVDPSTVFGKFIEFQRAGFDAVREIAENNGHALTQLSAIRDPKEYLTAQQSILQSVAEQNVAVLTRLFQSASTEIVNPIKVRKATERKGV